MDGSFQERFWKTVLRIWYCFPGKVFVKFLLEMHSVMVVSEITEILIFRVLVSVGKLLLFDCIPQG